MILTDICTECEINAKYYDQMYCTVCDSKINQIQPIGIIPSKRTPFIDICTHCEENSKYYFEVYCKLCTIKKRRNRKTAKRRRYKEIQKRLDGLRMRTIKAELPFDFTVDDFMNVAQEFNYRCAITESTFNLSVDHFIPLSIGHGGTYVGNVFPLSFEFNEWKDAENPFEWKRKLKKLSYRQKFNRLVDYLADLNGLSRAEFVDYVYWCFNNPRSKALIVADGNVSSIDLWMKAGKGRQ
ncbi:hypothetical protein ACFVS2_21610 [Brevibacillus sp. NPDC058079]|uniref:hypothetical protein n=1 Tax=Brevibacillus sp. NPDC058079 TaxID=3346330 RepID=UPI0036E48EE9